MSTAHTGSHLGPYEILGLLGAGGMGEAYGLAGIVLDPGRRRARPPG